VTKRRGNGEGSVYRRKDGLWVGQYRVQTPSSAKTKYIYSKNRKDAAAKLVKAIADRDSGFVFDSESLTVEQYLNRWLDTIRGTIRERTWKRSEEIVRLHLVSSLGKTRLDRLSSLQGQSLYSTKLDSGLSARTVRMIHTTLHKALKQAVKWSLIPRNVTEAVSPPREQKKEIKSFRQ
jgi:integrase